MQREVSNPHLERPQGTAARVTAFREYQNYASSFEQLVHGAQPGIAELAAVRRDREDTDQRQQAALPRPIEYGLALRHRVDHWGLRKERNDEGRVEPRLVVGGDDVCGGWGCAERP